ncbi:MAG: hypothetical protein ACR2H2_03050 [Solirubrobacteraceae bacterium]
MTLRIVAYDSAPDSAANRALQLDMLQRPDWLVSAESSRNKLLADIRRSDPQDPICALIDLVHDERDHRHRRGDRILTTITRHPELRARCIPLALTHYAGQLDINEAAWFAGARALISSHALRGGEHHHPVRALIDDLAAKHPRQSDVQRAPSPLPTVPPSPATQPQPGVLTAPAKFELWFGRALQHWELPMLEAIADHGDDQTAIVERMLALDPQRVARQVTEGAWRNRHTNTCRMLRKRGGTPQDVALAFLSYIGAPPLTSTSQWQLPDFEYFQRAATQARDDVAAWAAFISDADKRQLDRIAHGDAAKDPPAPKARQRLRDACDTAVRAACAAGRAPSPAAVQALLDLGANAMQAVVDAEIDYDHHPAVEIAHRLRLLQTTLTPYSDRAALKLRLTADPDRTLRLDGHTADDWETLDPPPAHTPDAAVLLRKVQP